MLGIGLGVMKNMHVGSSPVHDLQFVNSLPPNTVFTRASPAWGFNSSRDLVEIASGSPVFESFPGRGGLRIEGARTNQVQHSAIHDPNWGFARVTEIASSVERGLHVARVKIDDTDNTHIVLKGTIDITSGDRYTYSGIIKNGDNRSGGWIFLLGTINGTFRGFFNVLSMSIGSLNAVIDGAEIEDLGSGWIRCSMSATATASTDTGVNIGFADGPDQHAFTGNNSDDLFIMHFQIEQGDHASSIIVTTGSTVTRAAEVVTNTVIADSIDLTEGTVISRFSTFHARNIGVHEHHGWSMHHSTNDFIRAYIDPSSNTWKYRVQSGGIDQAFQTTAADVASPYTNYLSAVGYEANSFAGRFVSETMLTDVAGTVPTSIDEVQFGKGGSFELNGYLSSWQYNDTRLSNTIISEKVQ